MAIRPKIVSNYDLNITAGQARLFNVLLVYILPVLILAFGVIVFIRRKNR